MQAKQRARINLQGNGDLIAAVPYLLGFKPSESVVVCVYAGASRTQITLCLRADIPPPELYHSLVEQLKLPVLRANSCGVSVIVVCDGSVSPPDPLPHRKLVDTFAQVFSESAVAVHHAYWVSEIEEGATWWCYPDLECNGSVPDPTASELAATAACMGSVTYASKADIRTTLEPVDSASPAARAEQIKAALAQEQDEAVAQQLLDDLVQRVRDGKWALEEDRLVDLAVALKNVRVRDGCLHPEVTSIGRPIEEAWAELVRALPDPYRAEPACLLALTAFLRGDGVMAGVAVDLAIESDPDHSFAKLLRTSMDYGLPPDSVAAAVAQAFTDPAEPAKTHVPRPPITDGPRSLEIHASDPSNPHPPDNAQPPNE